MKARSGTLIVLVSFLTWIAPPASAKTIHVPGDYPTIQEAIDAAAAGDTVLVARGRYPELLDFKGKAIRLTSSRGPALTVIDAHWEWSPGVSFVNHESADAILEGFTITGATGQHANALLCGGSSPTIRNNVFLHNYAGDGVVLLSDAHPTFIGNVFTANGWSGLINATNSTLLSSGNTFSDNEGPYGVIAYLFRSTASFRGDVFVHNFSWGDGGVVSATYSSSVLFEDCRFEHNIAAFEGGVLACEDSAAELRRCFLSSNRAYGGGGAIGCHGYQTTTSVALTNCVLADNGLQAPGGAVLLEAKSVASIASCTFFGNRAIQGDSIACRDGGTAEVVNSILWGGASGREISSDFGLPRVAYCDVEGGFPGEGNIDLDPLLADPATGDFSLTASSPCIDRADPRERPEGRDALQSPRMLDGMLVGRRILDIGAAEYDHVHLAATAFVPGETATLHTSGTPGLLVVLVVGTHAGEAIVEPFGSLFVDLGSPWVEKVLGTIPPAGAFDVDVHVPPALARPLPIVLQVVGIQAHERVGNTSNSVEVVLQ